MEKTNAAFGAEFLSEALTGEYGCSCNDLQGVTLIVDGVAVGTVDSSSPGGLRRF